MSSLQGGGHEKGRKIAFDVDAGKCRVGSAQEERNKLACAHGSNPEGIAERANAIDRVNGWSEDDYRT